MLPSKRIERQPRASLLPGVLLCVILATVSASMPAREKCPDHIDCAREGRHFCKPGTSYCGPCLNPLDENEEGLCVARKSRRHHGKVTSFSDLDEEIDFLHSVIAKQEVSEINQSDTRSKAARTQTEAPRMRGQVQPSAGQPNTTQPSIHTPQPATGALGRVGAGGPDGLIAVPYTSKDSLLVIMISVCVIVGAGGLILATLFWVRLQKESRLAQKIDYPAFGSHGNGTANRTSDNDPKHTSRLCKGYLTKKESDGVLHQMTWLPQSPDLNQIEMVWEELDRKVKEKQPTSVQHMWEDCWKIIPGEAG